MCLSSARHLATRRHSLRPPSSLRPLSSLPWGVASPHTHLRLPHRGVGSTATPALQLRERVRDCLSHLEGVLRTIDAQEQDTSLLRESTQSLDGLFLLVVCGEFNAGKSSLLNALLGGVHCEEGVLPTTSTITLIKHPTTSSPPLSRGVAVREVPVAWLRDCQLVDTPGTNTIDPTHTALTQDFLPRADCVLFVTSADRPFSESERTFLAAIGAWHKKVLFLVNKADILPAHAVDEVAAYVSRNALAELGDQATVLPVSSRTALRLKERHAAAASSREPPPLGTDLRAVAVADDMLAAAQWLAFEQQLLQVLLSHQRVARKLQSHLSTASHLLSKYEARLHGEGRLVDEDVSTVRAVKARLEASAADTAADFEGQRARVQLVLTQLGQRGHTFLQEELQMQQLPRLLGKDALIRRFETRVMSDTAEQLQRTVVSVAEWMEAKSERHCALVKDLLERQLHTPHHAACRYDGYGGKRHALLLQLQRSSSEAIAAYNPSEAAARLVAAVHTSLAQAALLHVGAAGLSSAVALKATSLMDLTGLLPAFLMAATGLAILPMQRYRLQRELQVKVRELSQQTDVAIEEHLQQELLAAKQRSSDMIAPFALLVEHAAGSHAERMNMLRASRAKIDDLLFETQKLALTAEGGDAQPLSRPQ